LIFYDRAAGAIKLADDSGIGRLSIVPGAAASSRTASAR